MVDTERILWAHADHERVAFFAHNIIGLLSTEIEHFNRIRVCITNDFGHGHHGHTSIHTQCNRAPEPWYNIDIKGYNSKFNCLKRTLITVFEYYSLWESQPQRSLFEGLCRTGQVLTSKSLEIGHILWVFGNVV